MRIRGRPKIIPQVPLYCFRDEFADFNVFEVIARIPLQLYREAQIGWNLKIDHDIVDLQNAVNRFQVTNVVHGESAPILSHYGIIPMWD